MVLDLHDVPGLGDDGEPKSDLLSEVSEPLPSDDGIVNFTFGSPGPLLSDVKALARERGCSTNAAFCQFGGYWPAGRGAVTHTAAGAELCCLFAPRSSPGSQTTRMQV